MPIPRFIAHILQAAAIAAACLFSRQTLADTLELTNGRRLDVTVLEEGADIVRVASRWDTLHEVPRDRIAAITPAPFVLTELDEKHRAVDARNADALLELSRWCRKQGLVSQAYDYAVQAIEADPAHEAARREMGYRKGENDAWVEGPETRQRKQEYEDWLDCLERNLIYWNDKWVAAAEIDAMILGGEEWRGHWLTPAQKAAVDAAEKIVERDEPTDVETDMGLDLRVMESSLFQFSTYQTVDRARRAVETLTESYQYCLDWLQLPPDTRMWDEPMRILVFETKEDALKFYELYLQPDNPDAMTAIMRENPRTFWYHKPGVLMYKFEAATEEKIAGELLHILAHNVLYHEPRDGEPPFWLNEGFGSWLEYRAFQAAAGYCYGPNINARASEGEDAASHQMHFQGEGWMAWVQQLERKKKDRPLEEILDAEMNGLALEDLAKAYTVVAYLMERSPVAFGRLLREVKTAVSDDPDACLEAVFGQDADAFETAWSKWLRQQKTEK